MLSLASSSVRVSLLLLISSDIHRCVALITCEAGTFEFGKPASITCNFRTNISDTRKSFNMVLYHKDAPKGDIGSDVLVCRYSEKDKNQLCFLEAKNYTFDGVLTNQLTVMIPAVSFGEEGLYRCFFVPSDETDAHPCELTVVEAKPAGETEKSSDLLPVILPSAIGFAAIVCFVLGLLIFLHRRRLKSRARRCPEQGENLIPMQHRQIETLLKGFRLQKVQLQNLMQLLDQEMSKGLLESTKPEADIKMFPTFVSTLPNESGNQECVVVTFDHARLRVSLVGLQHQHPTVQSETYLIRPGVKLGTRKQLYDFIADRTKAFLQNQNMSGRKRPLSLIVAFPCKHESLETARLTKWTKECNNKGVVGEDLHVLLDEALRAKRRDSRKVLPGRRFDPLGKVEIVAVVNDTVSTLVSVALTNSGCKICLMVDSGLNACYVEDWKHIETDCPEDEKPQEMIINTELGALGENGCLDFCRTAYDKDLDRHSSSPGSQILEKMVGGAYVGEIVRLTLEKLTKEGLLFRAVSLSCALFQKARFNTEIAMIIEEDEEEAHRKTSNTLEGLGVSGHTDEDIKTVRLVCKLVFERAALLTASSLATLINRINQREVIVVVDGHIYRRHPRFHDLLYSKTLELVKPGHKFYLVSSRNSACPIGVARIKAASLGALGTDPVTD